MKLGRRHREATAYITYWRTADRSMVSQHKVYLDSESAMFSWTASSIAEWWAARENVLLVSVAIYDSKHRIVSAGSHYNEHVLHSPVKQNRKQNNKPKEAKK